LKLKLLYLCFDTINKNKFVIFYWCSISIYSWFLLQFSSIIIERRLKNFLLSFFVYYVCISCAKLSIIMKTFSGAKTYFYWRELLPSIVEKDRIYHIKKFLKLNGITILMFVKAVLRTERCFCSYFSMMFYLGNLWIERYYSNLIILKKFLVFETKYYYSLKYQLLTHFILFSFTVFPLILSKEVCSQMDPTPDSWCFIQAILFIKINITTFSHSMISADKFDDYFAILHWNFPLFS